MRARAHASVHPAGGDILKFAGDAVLVLFTGNPLFAALADRAVHFGLRLLEMMQEYNNTPLGMHIGVGVGNVASLHVGGFKGRWEHLVAGQVLSQIKCVDMAKSGEVCVSREVWQYIRYRAVGRAPPGAATSGAVIVKSLRPAGDSFGLGEHQPWFDEAPAPEELKGRQRDGIVTATRSHYALMYMSAAVRGVLHSHAEFLGEFRRVTVLFVHLQGLELERAAQLARGDSERSGVEVGVDGNASAGPDGKPQRTPRAVMRVNAVVNILFAELHALEGSMRQLIIDDKGTVAILCFGLRPAHPDDPARGVHAALNIQRELRRHSRALRGAVASIGVTTGRAFCSLVGNSARAEYAVVGSSVNMAARLMGKASGRVLCDQATAEAVGGGHHGGERATKHNLAFEEAERVQVKGFAAAQRVFVPSDDVDGSGGRRAVAGPAEGTAAGGMSGRMWGREEELRAVLSWCEDAARSGRGGLAIIEGETGLGKSLVLRRVAEAPSITVDMRVVHLAPTSIQSGTPYHLCTELFLQLFGIGTAAASASTLSRSTASGVSAARNSGVGEADEAEAAGFVREMARLYKSLRVQLRKMGPSALAKWPLLGDVFPFPRSVRDTGATLSLQGNARTSATRVLLTSLIKSITAHSPVVLAIDNLESLDSSSWALLLDVAAHAPNVVIVCAAAPAVRRRLPDYARVVRPGAYDWVMHAQLRSLSDADLTAVVCDALRIGQLGPQLQLVLANAADGNPFYAIETARLFQQRGDLVVTDGVAELGRGKNPLPRTASALTLATGVGTADGNDGAGDAAADWDALSRDDGHGSVAHRVHHASRQRIHRNRSGRGAVSALNGVDAGRGVSAALHSVLAGKMDLLDVEEQQTLKAASAIGTRFHIDCLLAVRPGVAGDGSGPGAAAAAAGHNVDAVAGDAVRAHVQHLVELGIFEAMHQPGRFAFKSSLMNAFVYNCMPFSTRRKLHLGVAAWLEAHPAFVAHDRAWVSAEAAAAVAAANRVSHTAGEGARAVAMAALRDASGATESADANDSDVDRDGAVESKEEGAPGGDKVTMLRRIDGTEAPASPSMLARASSSVTTLSLSMSAARGGGKRHARGGSALSASTFAEAASRAALVASPQLLALLVHHYWLGGDFVKAIAASQSAGEQAFRAAAYAEAAHYFRKALEIDADMRQSAPEIDGAAEAESRTLQKLSLERVAAGSRAWMGASLMRLRSGLSDWGTRVLLGNSPRNNGGGGGSGSDRPASPREAARPTVDSPQEAPSAAGSASPRRSPLRQRFSSPLRGRRLSLGSADTARVGGSPLRGRYHSPARNSPGGSPLRRIGRQGGADGLGSPTVQGLSDAPAPLRIGLASMHSTQRQLTRGQWESRIGLVYVELGRRAKAVHWLRRALHNFGVAAAPKGATAAHQREQLMLFPLLLFARQMPQHAEALRAAGRRLMEDTINHLALRSLSRDDAASDERRRRGGGERGGAANGDGEGESASSASAARAHLPGAGGDDRSRHSTASLALQEAAAAAASHADSWFSTGSESRHHSSASRSGASGGPSELPMTSRPSSASRGRDGGAKEAAAAAGGAAGGAGGGNGHGTDHGRSFRELMAVVSEAETALRQPPEESTASPLPPFPGTPPPGSFTVTQAGAAGHAVAVDARERDEATDAQHTPLQAAQGEGDSRPVLAVSPLRTALLHDGDAATPGSAQTGRTLGTGSVVTVGTDLRGVSPSTTLEMRRSGGHALPDEAASTRPSPLRRSPIRAAIPATVGEELDNGNSNGDGSRGDSMQGSDSRASLARSVGVLSVLMSGNSSERGLPTSTEVDEAVTTAMRAGEALVSHIGDSFDVDERARLQEIAMAAWPLLTIEFARGRRAQAAFLLGLVTYCAERLGAEVVPEAARGRCMLAVLLAGIGEGRVAAVLVETGLRAAAAPTSPLYNLGHAQLLAASFHCGQCAWGAADDALRAAAGVFVELQDERALLSVRYGEALRAFHAGALATCARTADAALRAADPSQQADTQTIALRALRAAALLLLGDLRACATELRALGDFDALAALPASRVLAIATRAALAVVQGRRSGAAEDCLAAADLLLQSPDASAEAAPALVMTATALLKVTARNVRATGGVPPLVPQPSGGSSKDASTAEDGGARRGGGAYSPVFMSPHGKAQRPGTAGSASPQGGNAGARAPAQPTGGVGGPPVGVGGRAGQYGSDNTATTASSQAVSSLASGSSGAVAVVAASAGDRHGSARQTSLMDIIDDSDDEDGRRSTAALSPRSSAQSHGARTPVSAAKASQYAVAGGGDDEEALLADDGTRGSAEASPMLSRAASFVSRPLRSASARRLDAQRQASFTAMSGGTPSPREAPPASGGKARRGAGMVRASSERSIRSLGGSSARGDSLLRFVPEHDAVDSPVSASATARAEVFTDGGRGSSGSLLGSVERSHSGGATPHSAGARSRSVGALSPSSAAETERAARNIREMMMATEVADRCAAVMKALHAAAGALPLLAAWEGLLTGAAHRIRAEQLLMLASPDGQGAASRAASPGLAMLAARSKSSGEEDSLLSLRGSSESASAAGSAARSLTHAELEAVAAARAESTRQWCRAVEAAQRSGMLFVAALAHAELGAVPGGGAAHTHAHAHRHETEPLDAQRHKDAAAEAFEACGAALDARRLLVE